MLGLDDLRTLYYFASGQPLSQVKTDAGWSRPGTQVLGGHHNVGRWSYLPYRRRAAITWACLAMVVCMGASVFVAPGLTLAAARLIGWFYLLPAALWMWWDFERRRQHRRDVLAPLGVALAARLNNAIYQLSPQQWIDTPVDPLDRPTRVYLPVGYEPSPSQEQTLVRLIARRIGLVSPHHTFYLQGEAPYVELTPAPAPRDSVTLSDDDVRAELENTPEGQYLLGFGARDKPVHVDLESESPHIALSVATGGGKSIAARAIAMQVLHEGGFVLVLDRKIESQLWAAKHPGVRFANTEEEIFRALIEASAEIDRRFELVRTAAYSDAAERPDVGPRFVIICEELNALEIDMRIWWRARREPSDPAQCPALPVLGRILAMGRAARTHMIVIAQKLTCQAIGGTAARENLSTRILGRATTSTWNMLAPECKVGGRFPKGSRHKGRMHVVVGDEATLTQVMYADDKAALDYSMEGMVRQFPDLVADVESAFGGEGGGQGAAVVLPGRMTGGEVAYRLTGLPGGAADDDQLELLDATGIPVEDEGELLTIAQYVGEVIEREGGDRKSLTKALTNARDRDMIEPRVKPGRGKPSLFHRDDLDDWMGRRKAGTGGGAL